MTDPVNPEEQNNRDRLILEAYRLAEANLQTETSIALATDQRAATFAGLLVAAMAILITASDKLSDSITDEIALCFFAFSTLMAGYVARGRKINPVGAKFGDFEEDISKGRSFSETISDLASFHDEASNKNRAALLHSSRAFNLALSSAAIGVALVVWPTLGAVGVSVCDLVLK